ncbi:uncharacterized protein NECHADRAFT_88197 [Fusarium vanettenii 77-13-4]|uniref:Protein kinase domain-containing protein n=1 Tax=Fusarium vanettenii (strain ATCC MYA-4622 / CBS 123669 / FGSC 9596 / NRRL 45880 / 77-13-4) TaxID=660122 RepID=C7ZDH1_FUSV7|nr:uncharacterized protein NECHADRAFT_88197 [Fusarium vanettenii 77-13-4]EEU37901.1 hypothetical protein NECHADRAFT_88197 [Fusarium vanettenii 77-13-4]
MCFKATPATVYRKCGHKSEGVDNLPFKNPPEECLSIGPSQGLAYALNKDIVLKLPFQYEVTQDTEMSHCWDLSIGSFVAMEKEVAVYEALKAEPHPNFAGMLATNKTDYLFLERLEPLQDAWEGASREERHRWVLELLAAVSCLEKLDFVSGDLAVRNIGVDGAKRLKLFDFGSAISQSHWDYANEIPRDRFNLSTCLHFLLSGVDPLANLHSRAEAVKIRGMMEAGQWEISEDASILADMIQDGWTGKVESTTFSELLDEAARILNVKSEGPACDVAGSYYEELEGRCQEWLRSAQRDPLWKTPDEYVLSCREVGHEADLDTWR